ncbi:MAG: hypothetical protein HZA50_15040 [Planctomycetes bacterium]|nr:hypothetical protein [Planctomycetota bacterium]
MKKKHCYWIVGTIAIILLLTYIFYLAPRGNEACRTISDLTSLSNSQIFSYISSNNGEIPCGIQDFIRVGMAKDMGNNIYKFTHTSNDMVYEREYDFNNYEIYGLPKDKNIVISNGILYDTSNNKPYYIIRYKKNDRFDDYAMACSIVIYKYSQEIKSKYNAEKNSVVQSTKPSTENSNNTSTTTPATSTKPNE